MDTAAPTATAASTETQPAAGDGSLFGRDNSAGLAVWANAPDPAATADTGTAAGEPDASTVTQPDPSTDAGSSTKEEDRSPKDAKAPATDAKATDDKSTFTKDELEQAVERRIQEFQKAQAQKAQEQADKNAKEAAKAAKTQAKADLQELARAARNGNINAQTKLLEQNLSDLDKQFQQDQVKAALKKELEPKLQEALYQKFVQHVDAFGLKPDDSDFHSVPAADGMAGINAVAIRKTASDKLVAAMLANDGVKAAIDKQVKAAVDSATKAARTDGMARALGSSEAPKLDPGPQSNGRTMSKAEIDRAYADNPSDRQLAQLWADSERAAGNYV